MHTHERALDEIRDRIMELILSKDISMDELNHLTNVFCDVLNNRLSYIKEEIEDLAKTAASQNALSREINQK